MDLKKSINQHDVRELTDWLVNILVQPQTGEGAVTPEKHFQMNLQEIRDALIGVEQVVNNLSTMTEGKVLDARQGKALKDMINLMNLNTVIEWQEQVLDSELPVAGELVGDRYLDLNVSDKIMTWTGSEFTAETPEENWAVFVRRTLVIYVYTGDQVWRVLGDFGIFLDTLQTMLDLLESPDFLLVVENMPVIQGVNQNQANINAVKNNEANINAVKANETNINAVKNNATNINKVAAINTDVTKVANIDTEVTTVSGVSQDVTKVAAIDDDVTKVANIDTDVTKVANIDTDVTKVANIDTKVTTVAAIDTKVTTVANISSNVTAVANNETNINAVKNNATNINAVKANEANITAVAGNATNINAVKNNESNINIVSGINTKISDLADRKTKIDDLHDELPQIASKLNVSTFEQYVDQELLTDSDVKHNSIDVQDLLLPGGVLTAAQLNSAGFHNSVFRGKVHPYPGFTVEQMAGIKNGTFYDLFPGDVITGPVTNIEYLVAHCNYKLRAGDTAVTENHVSLIPKGTLFTKYMNSTNTTTGGYKGSSMYTDIDGLPKALADFIELDFPGLVLSYREYVSTAIDSGSWGTHKCDLLSEVAAYGGIVNSSPGSNGVFHVGTDKSQLAVFSLRPDLLNIRAHWWLRGVSTSTRFCLVNSHGYANRYNASNTFGVRPLFHIYNPAP